MDDVDAFQTPEQAPQEEASITTTDDNNPTTPNQPRTLVLLREEPQSEASSLTGDSARIQRRPGRLSPRTAAEEEDSREVDGPSQFRAAIEAEKNEEGDGGESDEDGEDSNILNDAACEALLEGGSPDDESTAVLDTPKKNEVIMLKDGTRSTLKVPGMPPNWKPKACASEKGEPEFEDIDNPGNWSKYTFRSEFDAKGKYKHHCLPTGAMPVPPLQDGKRKIGDWEFFYDEWQSSAGTPSRNATDDDPFPDERKGCLDAEKLEELGLTKKRMKACDALFFWKLLLPIGDPKKAGVTDDGQKGFYLDVVKWTNLYAATEYGMDGTYGHIFKPVTLKDIVNWEGIIARHGVRGGNSAIHQRWDCMDCDYDDLIFHTMSFTRFLQIKRSYKLCNNFKAPKKSEPDYNPAWKYDRIYEVPIYNVNWFTKTAGLDLCGDESTWGFGGFGERGTGLVGLILGKPGVSKGGQVVLVSDVDRLRPRAYVHRHKVHEKPIGWNKQGPIEVRMIMDQIKEIIFGSMI